MTLRPTPFAEHRHRLPPWRHVVRFVVLATAVAIVLTNAYYLRLLEPRVSRKAVAIVLVALCAATLVWTERGLPRDREGWRALARRAVVPASLTVILALAFALRIWGITAGLPQSYIADEYDHVHAALRMMKGGDLNPHWWFHPTLQRYLTVGMYSLVFLAGAPAGRWAQVGQITVEDMLYWGRFVGVLCGTATVLVTYFLARRMFGPRVGLLAAALLAVFPGAVEHSQYNKPDPVVALLTTVSVLVALVYHDRGGKGLALACGVAVGLSASAKYNGLLAIVAFLVAAAIRLRGALLVAPDLYLGILGTVLGFFLGCPFALSELNLLLDQFANGMRIYAAGRPGLEGADNWANHGVYTSRFGAGYWATRAGVAGLALALYRMNSRLAVFLTFPILYYGYYSAQAINIRGNLIPVYPFLAVLAAYATVELLAWMGRTPLGQRRLVEPAVATALLGLLIVQPLRTAVRFDVEVTRRDTGSYAREWIDRTLPAGTHLALERFTPVLDGSRYAITLEPRLVNRSVQSYRDDGVQYLVTSSMAYDRFGPEHNQTRGYQKIFALCPLVAEFAPVANQRVGPTIRILRVPSSSSGDEAVDGIRR
ncbi:MAG TPA: glycosyltransferase family 39 protein [Vicinamibacteria bacterium]